MTKFSKEQLQNFVLTFNDAVISKLENAGFERNKYNVFDILNINRQELRHSDFLAFLMNPNRSGDIGKQFLHNFLSLLAKDNHMLGLDFFKMFYADFEKIVVKREYKNIDILLDITLSGNKYVFVIENKVDAGEQIYDNNEERGQLSKYKSLVAGEYKGYTPIYLFLSPDKRPPSESDWTPIDYNLIYSALCRLNTNTTDNTIKTLIQDYKKMIRGQFKMKNDKELRAAALDIYKANPDIFDFILANLPDRIKDSAEIIRKYLLNLDWVSTESDRQNANIVFKINDIKNIRSDLNIYFQIGVKTMWIGFYIHGGSEQDRKLLDAAIKGANVELAKFEWLVDNNKDKTNEMVASFDNMLLNNDLDSLEAKLTELLDKLFSQEGFVRKHSNRIYRLLCENK